MFVFHKTRAIRHLGSSQSCRLVNQQMSSKKKKTIVSLFFVKAKEKEMEDMTSEQQSAEVNAFASSPIASVGRFLGFAGFFTDLDRISSEKCFFYRVICNCLLFIK